MGDKLFKWPGKNWRLSRSFYSSASLETSIPTPPLAFFKAPYTQDTPSAEQPPLFYTKHATKMIALDFDLYPLDTK
jgi:hypothetical protein